MNTIQAGDVPLHPVADLFVVADSLQMEVKEVDVSSWQYTESRSRKVISAAALGKRSGLSLN